MNSCINFKSAATTTGEIGTLKGARERRARWPAVGSLFVVAVVVNYVWELAQAPLYAGVERYNPTVFWHCFVASLGDGVMVLLIVVVGWISFQRWDWFERPGVAGYLLMLIAGLILAVLVEWVGVYRLARWEYTEKMPIIPWVGIGLIPIAQMVILPPVIFRTALWLSNKR